MSAHDNFYEDIPAYMLGVLDRDEAKALETHAEDCKRCQDELRWLTPAVRALPETVNRETPPPQLRARLMAEVRSDAAALAGPEPAAARESDGGIGAWLRGLNVGGLTWKPLTGFAAAILIVAAFAGYEVGNNGGGGGTGAQPAQYSQVSEPSGITATVVQRGDRGSIKLTGVETLPKGRVLEAWVQRGEEIRPVQALFVPDSRGNATTQIADLKGVEKVLVTREPAGGTKAPTSTPIAAVSLNS